MEVAFFDTSALVKRYHVETGTQIVDKLMKDYVLLEWKNFIMLSIRLSGLMTFQSLMTKKQTFLRGM